LWLFANHPDQWERVCADRSLIPAALSEVLRIETPVQLFSRVLRTDYDADGVTVPEGARVLVMYGAGNRDERRYPDPDRFDIDRNPTDHLAFGYGLHACVGQPLAKIEAHAVLDALARRSVKLEAGEPTWKPNNIVRCIARMPITITG
jgi:cytochrome P450